MSQLNKRLNIPQGQLDDTDRWQSDNIMTNKIPVKRPTTSDKTVHRELNIEHRERH